LSSSEIADLLRGSRGTTVKIAVSREGYADPLVFNVTRDEIPRHAVDLAYEIKPGIGYIRLSGFNEKTDGELGEAMKQLDASTLDGLILDMRGNPGGLLDEAIAVGDMLLDKNQLIVSHRGRASAERRYYALRGNRGNDMPLVILVNNNSASATEIVAGAVQDHDRGVIVGETTFGKGLVQTLQPLSAHHRALLHSERQADSARLQIDFAVRVLRAQNPRAPDRSPADRQRKAGHGRRGNQSRHNRSRTGAQSFRKGTVPYRCVFPV
jgi:C-terminal peptidase prc